MGCNEINKEVKIVFDVNQGKTGDVSEVFEDRKIVFLETLEESLLTEVTKIICAEDRIYILDEPANSIVVFDTTGKFISAIRPSGRGPQEYMGISDFTINTSLVIKGISNTICNYGTISVVLPIVVETEPTQFIFPSPMQVTL
mgnify:CR=1 FL=1